MSEIVSLDELATSFAEFLRAEWPHEKALAWAHSGEGYAAGLWAEIVGLGWAALTVPEAHGGLGLGLDAAARLHMALGAAVAPVPMLGATLLTELLAQCGTVQQQEKWLPGLADGSLRAAIGQQGRDANGAIVDAASANLFVLRANLGGQAGWAVHSELNVERIALADTTRTMGAVSVANAQISDENFIAGGDDVLLRAAAIAIASDAIGGGEAVLSGTIDYMKMREQFGRAIGSFQALKHRVADHQSALVAARELVEHAAAMAKDDGQALLYALSAKQHATYIAAEVARDCIQLHGGVGFTSEYFPHLYLKRAKLNEALWGTRAALLDRIAMMLEAA